MAKLDKKAIEELVREVLEEREIPVGNDFRKKFGLPPKPTEIDDIDADDYAGFSNLKPRIAGQINKKDRDLKAKFTALASLDQKNASVSNKDIEAARNAGPTSDSYKLAQFLITKSTKNFTDWAKVFNPTTTASIQDPDKMGDIKDINMDKQVANPDSIAFGQMANIGFQKNVATAQTPMGQFQEGIAASISSFFKGKKTFKERVDHISQFSEMVFDNQNVAKMNLTKEGFLAAALFADYITTIVKEMDSGSAAYQFEALLAAMAGGNVAGKGDVDAQGNTVAGQMGAVDFMMNDGTFGSSKYYSKVGSGAITQSLTGFQNKAGKSTLYIIAHKKEERNKKTGSGTADPESITALNIYLVSVMPLKPIVTSGKDLMIKSSGKTPTNATLTSGGKLNLSKDLGEPIQIVLAGGSGEKLRDMLGKTAAAEQDKLKEAYRSFQELFKNLYQANQKAQRYASTGKKEQGNSALSSIVNADNALIDLVAEISGKGKNDPIKSKKIGGDRKDLKIAESKMTELDKLILEVFKNNS